MVLSRRCWRGRGYERSRRHGGRFRLDWRRTERPSKPISETRSKPASWLSLLHCGNQRRTRFGKVAGQPYKPPTAADYLRLCYDREKQLFSLATSEDNTILLSKAMRLASKCQRVNKQILADTPESVAKKCLLATPALIAIETSLGIRLCALGQLGDRRPAIPHPQARRRPHHGL